MRKLAFSFKIQFLKNEFKLQNITLPELTNLAGIFLSVDFFGYWWGRLDLTYTNVRTVANQYSQPRAITHTPMRAYIRELLAAFTRI